MPEEWVHNVRQHLRSQITYHQKQLDWYQRREHELWEELTKDAKWRENYNEKTRRTR